MSWVDGQVVTDWAAEIAKRERAIDGYLNDTDPARAATYGFRSGQNPQLAWSWFRDNPVGFNGVPFVLFKTILDLDPNHENPTLRAIARIWKREAIVPAGSGTPATRWTFDHIGIGPNPSDYVDGVARPADERQSPLPFGFAFENPRTFEPLSAAETARLRRPAAGATRSSEHESADRQDANRRQGGELGTRSARLREPGCDGSRVLFVRGLPRRPRDGGREDEVPSRHAEHRDRGAVLLEAADAHRRGAGRVRVRPRVDHSGEPRQHQAQYGARFAPCTRRCWTRRVNGRKRCTVRLPRRSPAQRFRRWRSPTSSRASCRISSPSA